VFVFHFLVNARACSLKAMLTLAVRFCRARARMARGVDSADDGVVVVVIEVEARGTLASRLGFRYTLR
jgi:hypothetical protein